LEESEAALRKHGFNLVQAGSSYLVTSSAAGSESPTVNVFVLLGGNGMTALDWSHWVIDVHPFVKSESATSLFVLVEYPGYGKDEGQTSPDSMHSSVSSAVDFALSHINTSGKNLGEVNVLGHSMGAAVGTRWVGETSIEVSRLILSAPFTSVSDMVSEVFPFIPRVIGKLIARHDWDNHASISKIAIRGKAKRVILVHGRADEIVPFRMVEELARIKSVSLIPIENASHNGILSFIRVYGLLLTAPLVSKDE
jgi:pimeloyl-ACP methyl ester carboxylesterase